ncbi:MAG: DNA primase [Paludibacteraceae bacterium]|nr:DNA primase [Paludibacteraceae bacterium]MBQ5524292.1 DNA primase [Paludibacteraceae bacterium]
MIDHNTVQKILDAAHIEEVVGDFVSLRRRGVNLIGLCPFHNEKTPSFTVSPAKNICHCFGCGKGGGPVNFIMEHESLSYVDALRYLAKKYGIEIVEKEETAEEIARRSSRENMFALNAFALKYFSDTLHNTEEGKSIGIGYFRERGFRDDTIKKFQLGYCPDRFEAVSVEALKEGFSRQTLIDTGLCTENQRGGLTDRFRGRVIFPVHTVSGQVVAFGGRVLKKTENTAKYVNSPESEIYHKSSELYGLYFAKNAIQRADVCYLVEGYTDVISMHQAGVENVVASSGTSLTTGQIRLIHRFTSNIVVLYDGDAAGIKASIRGIDMLLEEGMNVEVVLLPDGEDPDSFSRSQDSTQFIDYINRHKTNFILFKTQLLLGEAGNDPIKKAALIGDIVESISKIQDTIKQAIYIKDCARQFDIREEVLIKEVAKRQKNHAANAPQATAVQENAAVEHETTGGAKARPYTFKEERQLLRYLLRHSNDIIEINSNGERIPITVIDYIAGSIEADGIPFQYPLHIQILDEALSCTTDLRTYFLNHPDVEVQNYVFSLVEDRYEKSAMYQRQESDAEKRERLSSEVQTVMFEYRFAIIKRRCSVVKEQIEAATAVGDNEKVDELLTELQTLNQQRRQISAILGGRPGLR